MKSLVSIMILIPSLALAFSRGPYLPDNSDIQVPYGSVVFQQGADENGEYTDLDYTDVGVVFSGDVVVQLLDGRYEVVEMQYSCEIIDDGAYGALACDSAEFIRSYGSVYTECEFDRDGYWCE